ncbi:MAG TPA: DUF72 domain-containing protein [Coriobacteriia bacterium]|nr:DUF72 domain-containing protein [Coriobacteriia bacterium]
MGDVVVGTCSWTDKTMIERWYPSGVNTAESRLRYYASRFDTVEIDSSFYGIPKVEYARHWAERTPKDFTFHVKAFGMLTGHDVDERALHPELRDGPFDYELTNRGRVRHPDERMRERANELFLESIEPLAEAGKLGGILMQYPPWFTAVDRTKREQNLAEVAHATELLQPYAVFVEFRHASWVADSNVSRTMKFLADHGLSFVSVDAPAVETGQAMPPLSAATAPLGYVRFHGRNRETWHARTASAADRFDYLYEPAELAEWREPIERLAEETERTWVMFNNCKYDYAPRNAREMAGILGDIVAPRADGALTGDPLEEGAGGTSRSGAEEGSTGTLF